MSAPSPRHLDGSVRRSARIPARRVVLAALAGAVVATAVVAGCTAVPSGPDGAPASSAPGATTAAPTGTATTAATTTAPSPSRSAYTGPPPATAPVVGASTLPPVEQGTVAGFGDGLSVEVVERSSVDVTASGPGERSGPATAVLLELVNGSPSPVSLDGVTVTATSSDGTPQDGFTGEPADVPSGVLAPGARIRGTWVFSASPDAASSLVVTSVSSASALVLQL
ncbi:hypothetical protein [Quadrisphaera sp. INWT6]|uniref:hypothetical protein n=1 Tax=Quadrisphaera sp. INWT6 TaxID=2596917 RepID=UPI001891FF78|nr:hypothetical protein [Quadrisphaera sp. INWT6]MBF5080359.1 hypothetical protein [Quadrisphaera sp. INWT6]